MIPERWADALTRVAKVRAYGTQLDVDDDMVDDDDIADTYDEAHQAYVKYYDVWGTVDDGGEGILREGMATPSDILDFESFVRVLADDYQYLVRTYSIENAASELTQSACLEDPEHIIPSVPNQPANWIVEGF